MAIKQEGEVMAEKKTAKKSTTSTKKSTAKKTTKKSTTKTKAAAKKTTKPAAKKTAEAKTTNKKKSSQLEGFMDFVREQGVVGLAIAVVIGVAAKDAVDGLVAGVINPLVGMFLNADSLSSASFIVADTSFTNGPTEFQYGLFLEATLNLLIVAAVVYFVIKKSGLSKLDKKKD